MFVIEFFLVLHNTHIFFAVQILGDSHPCYNNLKLRCVYKYYGYNCGNNERIFLLFCKKLFVKMNGRKSAGNGNTPFSHEPFFL